MADETVGALVVKLIFETNAGEILGQLSAQAGLSKESLDQLIASGQAIPLVFNPANEELQKVVTTLTSARAAGEPVREMFQTVSETATATSTTFREVSNTGKEFTVTINKMSEAEEASVGTILSAAEAAERGSVASESAANAAAQVAAELEAEAAAAEKAAAVTKAGGEEQLGIIETLKGDIADLKLQIDRATDPTRAAELTAQLREMEAQLKGIQFGNFQQGLGTIQELQVRLAAARAELAGLNIEMDPARANELSASIRMMERDLANMTGKGIQYARNEFRNLRMEHFAVQQGLISLMFLMNAFSTEGASAETKKLQQAMQGGLGTALALQLALSALMPGLGAGLQAAVGLGAGALVSLIAYLNETDEASKKAAEQGLKELTDAIKNLPYPAQVAIPAEIRISEDQLKAEIDRINAEAPKRIQRVRVEGEFIEQEVPVLTDAQKERIKLLQDEIDQKEKSRKESEKTTDAEKVGAKQLAENQDILAGHLTELQAINEQLKIKKEEQQTGIDHDIHAYNLAHNAHEEERLSSEQLQERAAAIAALEKERHTLMLSADDLLKENVKQSEIEYKLRESTEGVTRMTVAAYREQLETAIAQTSNDADRLGYAEKLKELNADIVASLRDQFESQKISSTEYFTQLESLRQSNVNATQRLSIHKEEQSLLIDRATLTENELKRGAITIDQAKNQIALIVTLMDNDGNLILSKTKIAEIQTHLNELVAKQLKDEKAITEEVNQLKLSIIGDETEKATAAENERNKKRLEAINTMIDVTDEGQGKQEQRQYMIDYEAVLHANNLAKINADHTTKLQELRIQNITDDESRIRAMYGSEIKDIETNIQLKIDSNKRFVDKGLLDQKAADADNLKTQEEGALEIAALRKKMEREVSDVQLQNLDKLIGNIDQLANALHRAFTTSGDEFIQKMLAALQIALQIAKTIEEANARASQGSGGFDIGSAISTATGVISFISLFQQGGVLPGEVKTVDPNAVKLIRQPGQEITPKEVQGGSYVVKEDMAVRYKAILDVLGAQTVEGGVKGKDSVPLKTDTGLALAMPGERILPPHLAPLGQLMNTGLLDETKDPTTIKTVLAKYSGQTTIQNFVHDFIQTASELFRFGRPVVLEVPPPDKKGSAFRTVGEGGYPALALPAFQVGGVIPNIAPSIVSAFNTQLVQDASIQLGDLSPIIDELRALRAENGKLQDALKNLSIKAEIPDKVAVDILNQELNFRDQSEKYAQYQKQKQV